MCSFVRWWCTGAGGPVAPADWRGHHAREAQALLPLAAPLPGESGGCRLERTSAPPLHPKEDLHIDVQAGARKAVAM